MPLLQRSGNGECLGVPRKLIPQLDDYGEQGWELVSVQPVFIGENEDITYYGDNWTHHYLCFFKRSKAEK